MAKILIVEDNQGTNKAICEYMKEAGHTLFSAFTGSEALKIFREKELDIIVLDMMNFPHGLKMKRKIFKSWSMLENGQKQKRQKHLSITMKSLNLF